MISCLKQIRLILVLFIIMLSLLLYLYFARNGICNTENITSASLSLNSPKELYPPFYNHLAVSFFSTKNRSIDKYGVIIQNYDGKGYNEPGWQYSPTLIGQYILYCIRKTINSEEVKDVNGRNTKDIIEANANYLVKTAIKRQYNGKEFIVWKFDFPNPTFLAPSGWVSAMTNGICAVALLEASQLITEHSDEYKNIAIKAAHAFMVPVDSGGVMSYLNKDSCFFEEIAYPNIEKSHILNGNLYGLFGLRAFALAMPEFEDIYKKGINGTINLLDKYDAGFISLYDLNNCRLAPRGNYNFIHIQQLLFLYLETRNPLFLEYAVRFARYEKPAKYSIYNNSSQINSLSFGKKDFWKKAGIQQIKIVFDKPQQVESIFVQSKYNYSGFDKFEIKASLGKNIFIPSVSLRKSASGLDHAIIFDDENKCDIIYLELKPINKELQLYGIDVLTKERRESSIAIIYDTSKTNNTIISDPIHEDINKYVNNKKLIVLASNSQEKNVDINKNLKVKNNKIIDYYFIYDKHNAPFWFGLNKNYDKEYIRVIEMFADGVY